jgi:dTDP-4-amino-4,6-dideoxygalactose transaminase
MLDRRWITNNGPFVQELEQKLADFPGVRHCLAVCNATVGMEIALRATGLSGEVIVPSFTFIATAHACRWLGLKHLFADIRWIDHAIDVADVERCISDRTTGIIGVHTWGNPCETSALQDLADRYSLRVLYDAAHAFGVRNGQRMVGGFGDCEVFSFHGTKFFNSFEGGAITTNDDALAAKIALMRNFGFAGLDNVVLDGTNGKLSEIHAAMGLTSLESLPFFLEINRRNYHAYANGLEGLPVIQLHQYQVPENSNCQYVVIDVDPESCPLSRDELLKILTTENVMARRYFWPCCHGMLPYREENPDGGLSLPVSNRVASGIIVLPTGECTTLPQVELICGIIRRSLQQADRLKAHFTRERR